MLRSAFVVFLVSTVLPRNDDSQEISVNGDDRARIGLMNRHFRSQRTHRYIVSFNSIDCSGFIQLLTTL